MSLPLIRKLFKTEVFWSVFQKLRRKRLIRSTFPLDSLKNLVLVRKRVGEIPSSNSFVNNSPLNTPCDAVREWGQTRSQQYRTQGAGNNSCLFSVHQVSLSVNGANHIHSAAPCDERMPPYHYRVIRNC